MIAGTLPSRKYSLHDISTRSFTNRLETRTKESTECASVLVSETIRRAMKVTTFYHL